MSRNARTALLIAYLIGTTTKLGSCMMIWLLVMPLAMSGTGVVRFVNRKEGWLEIDHEAIKGLMPAMQMEWSVKEGAMLQPVRVGDKVNFTVEDNNGSEIITKLKKPPPAK